MNILMWLAVGVSVGWVGSLLVGTDSREGLIRNLIVGTAGALLGGWVLGFVSETGRGGGITAGAIFASVAGAAVLFVVVSRITRA